MPKMSDRQLTLGGLIEALRPIRDKKNLIYFDFCDLVPTIFESYRGYYEDLALCWAEGESPISVATLLALANQTVGMTFEGYKGGSFRMDKDTPIWVANYGKTGDTVITGVRRCSYYYVLTTANIEVEVDGAREERRSPALPWSRMIIAERDMGGYLMKGTILPIVEGAPIPPGFVEGTPENMERIKRELAV